MVVPPSTSSINTACFSQDRRSQDRSLSLKKVTSIQLARRVIYSSFMRVVYQIATIGCQLLSFKESMNYYRWKSSYHQTIVQQSLGANRTFGKNLMSFSTNRTPHPQQNIPSHSTEFDILKKRYGQDLETYIETINSNDAYLVSIDSHKMRQPDDGICLGMSLDFIAQVLHRSDANETEIAAIQRIGSVYEKGSTPRAEILQMIQKARNFKKLVEYQQKLESKFLTLSEAQQEAFLQEFQNMVKKTQAQSRIEHFKAILNLDFHSEDFSGFTNVKPGFYLIGSDTHAMAYFRLKDVGILFDPNRGCCQLSNQADYTKFEKDLIHHYCKNDSQLSLIRCSVN